MPRRKPNTVKEERISLGTYERQLAQDKLTVDGLQALATAVSGIAQGLGVFGALGIGALLWGKDLEKVFEQIVGIWPESGRLFSPEWIARWGADPMDITEADITAPDNPLANELDPTVSGRSFEGKSGAEVYQIASSGRSAAYDHARNNIIQWTYEEFLEMKGWKIYNHPEGYGPNTWEATVTAQWHRDNPQPGRTLTIEEQTYQTNIRITCARNKAALQPNNPLSYFVRVFGQETNPINKTGYVEDVLLDWLAYSSPKTSVGPLGVGLGFNVLDAASPSPYNYALRKSQALNVIQAYSWWQAPSQP